MHLQPSRGVAEKYISVLRNCLKILGLIFAALPPWSFRHIFKLDCFLSGSPNGLRRVPGHGSLAYAVWYCRVARIPVWNCSVHVMLWSFHSLTPQHLWSSHCLPVAVSGTVDIGGNKEDDNCRACKGTRWSSCTFSGPGTMLITFLVSPELCLSVDVNSLKVVICWWGCLSSCWRCQWSPFLSFNIYCHISLKPLALQSLKRMM